MSPQRRIGPTPSEPWLVDLSEAVARSARLQSEVGRRRGPGTRGFSVGPFPNRAGQFPGGLLSSDPVRTGAVYLRIESHVFQGRQQVRWITLGTQSSTLFPYMTVLI